MLQPKTPLYLLFRRPESGSSSLCALTYIPSNAPVRAKTLFASTRATLVRELGSEKFATTIFATEEDEVTSEDAWRERDAERKGSGGKGDFRREDLMGDKERELEAVRRAEEEARSGTPGRDIGIGGSFARGGFGSGVQSGMRMTVDDDVKTALDGLQDGGLVQLVRSLISFLKFEVDFKAFNLSLIANYELCEIRPLTSRRKRSSSLLPSPVLTRTPSRRTSLHPRLGTLFTTILKPIPFSSFIPARRARRSRSACFTQALGRMPFVWLMNRG